MSQYSVYRKIESLVADRVVELLIEHGAESVVIDVATARFSRDHIGELLEMLGLWPVGLIDSSSSTWQDSHLNEESDDTEVIEFICENPEVIRTPIVIKDGGSALFCDPAEEVFHFFS